VHQIEGFMDKEMYKGIWNDGVLQGGNPEEIFLTFPQNSCRYSKNEVVDSDELRRSEMSLLSEMSTDSGSESVV
jgi:hypothetical protein